MWAGPGGGVQDGRTYKYLSDSFYSQELYKIKKTNMINNNKSNHNII